MSPEPQVHPLTPFVELFERRGPRGGHRNAPAYGCWCMYWRDRSLGHGTPKKRALESLGRAGKEPGLLAYDRAEAVGWASVAQREEYTPSSARLSTARVTGKTGCGRSRAIRT